MEGNPGSPSDCTDGKAEPRRIGTGSRSRSKCLEAHSRSSRNLFVLPDQYLLSTGAGVLPLCGDLEGLGGWWGEPALSLGPLALQGHVYNPAVCRAGGEGEQGEEHLRLICEGQMQWHLPEASDHCHLPGCGPWSCPSDEASCKTCSYSSG